LKTDDVFPFRPPCGKVNLFTLLFLLFRHVPICLWTLDTRDTWPALQRDDARVKAKLEMSGGAIILAHDFDRQDSSIDRYVLKMLRATLEYATCHGIQLCTMTEAMQMPRPETAPSGLASLYGYWSSMQERLFERLSASYTTRSPEWHPRGQTPEYSATGPKPPSDAV